MVATAAPDRARVLSVVQGGELCDRSGPSRDGGERYGCTVVGEAYNLGSGEALAGRAVEACTPGRPGDNRAVPVRATSGSDP